MRRAGRARVQHEGARGAAVRAGDRARLPRLRARLVAAAPRARWPSPASSLAVVALSWIAVVELTPASQRPFVGSTSTNSEIQLIFGYNGFGRVGGQQGGPGSTTQLPRRRRSAPLVRPGRRRAGDAGRAALLRDASGRRHRARRHRRHARRAAHAAAAPHAGRPVRASTLQPGADLRHGPRRPGRLGRAAGAARPASRCAVRRARGARDRRAAGAVRARRLVPGRAGRRSTSRTGSCTPTTPRRSGPGSRRWSARAPSRSPRSCAAASRGAALRGYVLAVLAVAGTVARAAVPDRALRRPDCGGGSRSSCCRVGALIAIPLLRARAPAGRSASPSARCSSRRWSTASASGWRR